MSCSITASLDRLICTKYVDLELLQSIFTGFDHMIALLKCSTGEMQKISKSSTILIRAASKLHDFNSEVPTSDNIKYQLYLVLKLNNFVNLTQILQNLFLLNSKSSHFFQGWPKASNLNNFYNRLFCFCKKTQQIAIYALKYSRPMEIKIDISVQFSNLVLFNAKSFEPMHFSGSFNWGALFKQEEFQKASPAQSILQKKSINHNYRYFYSFRFRKP